MGRATMAGATITIIARTTGAITTITATIGVTGGTTGTGTAMAGPVTTATTTGGRGVTVGAGAPAPALQVPNGGVSHHRPHPEVPAFAGLEGGFQQALQSLEVSFEAAAPRIRMRGIEGSEVKGGMAAP